MSAKKSLLLIVSVVLLLMTMHTALFAAISQPARIGGTVTIDDTQLTQGTAGTDYTFTVTKQDDTAYNPVAEDTDGLTSDWYLIDIPIYDAGGAQPGETAVIHVYLDAVEFRVTSPSNGEFQVGDSGTTEQIDIIAYTNNLPSAPELVYPSNGQTGGLETTVKFKWKKSTDPDGDTLTYDLYVCENEGFTAGCITQKNIVASSKNTGVYYAGSVSGAGLLIFGIALSGSLKGRRKIALLIAMIMITGMLLVSCGDKDTDTSGEVTSTVSGLSPGTLYHWKVVADDGNGGRAGSEVRSFTTQ